MNADAGKPARPRAARPPGSTLSVWSGGAWREWWRGARAPVEWSAPETAMTRALTWRRAGIGVEMATARLAGSWPAWRTRLVVARIDPRRVRLSLELSLTRDETRPAWSIDRAPRDALAAFNAGQFVRTLPWGWLVMDGRERLRPGVGPLSVALVVSEAGGVRWIAGDSLARADSSIARGVTCAFQSYPVLLEGDGTVPPALRAEDGGVDLAHRDARLAIGETREGLLLVALTRFDAMGEAAGAAPIGLTTPEMAAVMGALGARTAVSLDGGISAQMTIRDPANGRRWSWPGLRKVPLALIVRPR